MKQRSGTRVCITGIGLVTPAGVGVSATWDKLLIGNSLASRDDSFEASVTLACRVPDFDPKQYGIRKPRQFDRYSQFALVAASEALQTSGIDPTTLSEQERDSFAVFIGSGAAGVETFEAETRNFAGSGEEALSARVLPKGLLNMAAGAVSMRYGLRGPCIAHCTACTSGASAIGEAKNQIQSGQLELALAGASEAPLTPLFVSAFDKMGALSRSADPANLVSRPFDRRRSGFVISEGAAVLVLEAEEHARKRGKTPIAYVDGYGASADAHHVTSPHPEGRGAKLAVARALHDARVASSAISVVNAHGTSTVQNDKTEAETVQDLYEPKTVVTANKGVLGHSLGAASAIEAAISALSLERKVLTPNANLENPEASGVRFATGQPDTLPGGMIASHSFGFGGQNAALIFSGT